MSLLSLRLSPSEAPALRVRYFHGPDRLPLSRGADGALVSSMGVPFHGIASRAAIEHLPSSGLRWDQLHEAGVPSAWLAAREVLSFTESASVATAAVAREHTLGDCELWCIKEGHTASVWIAQLPSGERRVLNVARDPLASAELAAVTDRLRRVSLEGDGLASVLDGFWIERAGASVFVAVQRLIEDAFEIHQVRGRYGLVERFITAPERPAHIIGARGRWATAAETAAIDALRDDFARVAGPLGLELAINEGDLVWAEGRGPRVVAAGLAADSEQTPAAPIGE